jgi:hypothetical protein
MDTHAEELHKRPLTAREKWILAAIIGVVAIVFFAPLSFVLSQRVGSIVGIKTLRKSGPTCLGFTLHVVFFVVVFRALLR